MFESRTVVVDLLQLRAERGRAMGQRALPLAQALWLARLDIAVVPGATLTPRGRCGCADPYCRLPGAHPLGTDWAVRASSDVRIVRRWWTAHPDAAVLVPLSPALRVLDVPAEVGGLALSLLTEVSAPAGPIVVSPTGRYLFWVRPEIDVELAAMWRRQHGTPRTWDLRVLGAGGWAVVPPTPLGQLGRHRWERSVNGPLDSLPYPRHIAEAITLAALPWTSSLVRHAAG